ncbi:hypothetical protein TWF481_002833 [Arthrobotrys musiformis]|uniref:Uncharacterized protein n=1 Tax=Arthrobotrys musiformis TaxID=47236 RepID=A0AAV9VU97_9PEZI
MQNTNEDEDEDTTYDAFTGVLQALDTELTEMSSESQQTDLNHNKPNRPSYGLRKPQNRLP